MLALDEADIAARLTKERNEDHHRQDDARFERIEKGLGALAQQSVPRTEYGVVLEAQRAREADLTRQVEHLRGQSGDLAAPRDALLSLQRRVDDLERSRRPFRTD